MEDETSPSSRRAWIEISSTGFTISASRSPSSRRAWIEIRVLQLRREGKLVALLAEGVDRNRRLFSVVTQPPLSPSSRRAWIEMALPFVARITHFVVALLAEGVDRNTVAVTLVSKTLSVALLAEGVDRNIESRE